MAQINITLDQDEIIRLLEDSSGEAFKLMLQKSLNAVLLAESAEQIGAGRYERAESRADSRNGTRTRPLTLRAGTIDLTVPRHRNVPFKTMVFENYKRSEAAIVTTMAEMVVGGVSTAKVCKLMETICGKGFSKSTVSEACAELDDAVEEFRTRPIEGDYLFVMVDATYLKVRVDHRIRPMALMIAMAMTGDGMKEIVGFGLEACESRKTWKRFLSSLRARGLAGMSMFTSDAHEGLVSALQEVYPDVPWQRCQAHFSRNVSDAAPKRLRAGLRSELVEMFNCATLEEARSRRDEIAADYDEEAPEAVARLDAGFEDAMTVMALPPAMRRCVRTSNYLERLNAEVKRRSKVIGVFPSEGSVARLVGTLLIEENDRWSAKSKQYYRPAVEELKGRKGELEEIARTQRRMRLAS